MTIPDDIEQFATVIGPRPDEILMEMDRRAEETEFPTVGPAVGGWLQQLAGLVGAERVFEFGSGFGYSAYWFARALPADGEIVLTEIDAGELESAREYLGRGGYADRARFEHGDAIETIERYEGPFDVVLIDNEKDRYVEAFEAVRSKLSTGGIVVADNAMEGPFEFETLRRLLLDDADAAGLDTAHADAAEGVVSYLEHLGSVDEFETTLLPLGEGLAVSRRL
jgi:predicted O-methyltransferase YrrM